MKDIHITIFCDESKNRKIGQTICSESQNWNYIGVCIVPTAKINDVSNGLNNLRCGAKENYLTCKKNCKYHEMNKKKIHYTQSQNGYIYNSR